MSIRHRTGWARFATRVERIRVKGGDDVESDGARDTAWSGDQRSGQHRKGFKQPQFVLALRWSALEPSDTTIAAIRALNKARNVDQAEQALAQFQVVTQSALIADVDGRIGMVVTGRIPMRDRTNDLHGIVPAPGWDARYDWRGYLPQRKSAEDARPGQRIDRHRESQGRGIGLSAPSDV